MSSESISYKCPSCGAQLIYDPGGKLKCGACGNAYTPEILKKTDPAGEAFRWDPLQTERVEAPLENTAVYVCRACGAAIEADATAITSHCPFCDNELILTDRLSDGLRPNVIIPFAIGKEDAVGRVREHFKNKKLLPGNFRSTHTLEKLQAIYVPFWLFDAVMDGEMVMEGVRTRHYSDDEYDYTETSRYHIEVDGSIPFVKLPIDASVKMSDDLMDAIGPYDYRGLKPFSPAYLSGFLADRFDETPESSLPRAAGRMRADAEITLRKQIGRYDTVTMQRCNIDMRNPSVRYALLPVYLLNVLYGGKSYRFAVNGQSGKVTGELPQSRGRMLAVVAGWTAGLGSLIGTALYLLIR
ncbi:MAG: hypothetical protein IJJ85_11425 [Clostridia bacterium]|nr:hypothetical protein [Clostridia bacterium]